MTSNYWSSLWFIYGSIFTFIVCIVAVDICWLFSKDGWSKATDGVKVIWCPFSIITFLELAGVIIYPTWLLLWNIDSFELSRNFRNDYFCGCWCWLFITYGFSNVFWSLNVLKSGGVYNSWEYIGIPKSWTSYSRNLWFGSLILGVSIVDRGTVSIGPFACI